jgi:hypothetical protein
MRTVQLLPPKMALKFANDARAGKADRKYGDGRYAYYEFDQGSNVVVLTSIDPPFGHIRRKEPHERNAI